MLFSLTASRTGPDSEAPPPLHRRTSRSLQLAPSQIVFRQWFLSSLIEQLHNVYLTTTFLLGLLLFAEDAEQRQQQAAATNGSTTTPAAKGPVSASAAPHLTVPVPAVLAPASVPVFDPELAVLLKEYDADFQVMKGLFERCAILSSSPPIPFFPSLHDNLFIVHITLHLAFLVFVFFLFTFLFDHLISCLASFFDVQHQARCNCGRLPSHSRPPCCFAASLRVP